MGLKTFKRRTAERIAIVSLTLACLSALLAGMVAREQAEESTVQLAIDESRRLLTQFHALDVASGENGQRAVEAARALAGGLFDIAELYDAKGKKLAEALTAEGEAIESLLPTHARPAAADASYESLHDAEGRWILRVFVPVRSDRENQPESLLGYFEGVRVIPAWQRDQIFGDVLATAAMIGLAALLCGAAIYPVVVYLSADNERKAREVLDSHIAMMEALGRAIAKRDSDTGAHNYRVAWIAAQIGEHIGLDHHAMQSLIVGSFLHDVGKIGIPDAILLKPGKLDAAEFEVMRTHVALGEEIVRGIGWLDGAADVVVGHHEKWDGSGYPRGLRGIDIPLAARIFAVADVFDALTSRRPYKAPMSFSDTMAILQRDTGTHFDPGVMAVFSGIAGGIHTELAGGDENAARELLELRVRAHFGS